MNSPSRATGYRAPHSPAATEGWQCAPGSRPRRSSKQPSSISGAGTLGHSPSADKEQVSKASTKQRLEQSRAKHAQGAKRMWKASSSTSSTTVLSTRLGAGLSAHEARCPASSETSRKEASELVIPLRKPWDRYGSTPNCTQTSRTRKVRP